MEERCTRNFVPWLLAWQYGFLPDEDCLHEVDDIGDDQTMVRLASFTVPSNVLFTYDQEWGRS